MRMVPSEFRKFRAASCLSAVLTLSVLFGCSRSAPAPKSNEFFVTWLRGHGESNVVVDAQGVGIAGNPTRLRSSLYGSKKFTNSFTAELEFRVRIPDGREIVENVIDHRLTGDWQQRFGLRECEWVEPGRVAGSENNDFHVR